MPFCTVIYFFKKSKNNFKKLLTTKQERVKNQLSKQQQESNLAGIASEMNLKPIFFDPIFYNFSSFHIQETHSLLVELRLVNKYEKARFTSQKDSISIHHTIRRCTITIYIREVQSVTEVERIIRTRASAAVHCETGNTLENNEACEKGLAKKAQTKHPLAQVKIINFTAVVK